MGRRLPFLLILVLLVAAPAAADIRDRKEAVDAKIESLNSKIAEARRKEQALAAQIESVSSKIRELEGEVGDVSTDLAVLEQDLALQREKLARITELWRLQTRKLAFLRGQHEAAIDRLSNRLVAAYEGGEVTPLDVVFSAASFDEALSSLDYVKRIAAQDRRIAAEVARARVEMAAARKRTQATRTKVKAVAQAIAIRTEQQRELRNRLVSSRDALAGARSQKQDTLESVEESKAEYLAEVAALAAVSSQLAAQIQASQSAPTAYSPPPSRSSSGVPSSSGLIWPVSGPVTSPFGWRWGRMHEGIDIAAPTGAPIAASAAGRVIHAGWMGGYGLLVVVDHGNGLSTAYAHNSSIPVGSGQTVAQGQTIGAVGCTGHCFGAHLHFEVRVNGSPVDPLGYL